MLYDVIVIGGGHAGVEAAYISSKKKNKTLLITNNVDNIGILSCNPSIGGVGKGQLVKEIDILGGMMGKAADKSGIQFKVLNKSKGEASWSTRVQINRLKYKKNIQNKLKRLKYLNIKQETVDKLIIKNMKIKGIKTNLKNIYFSKIVIITTGTFLNGCLYIGFKKFSGGRFNDKTSNYLANQLKEYNFFAGRLKTGTPPRLDSKNINFNKLKVQKGDNNPIPYFSKYKKNILKQKSCWITSTNKKTHEIIKISLKNSPLYNKIIDGTGPRYCPSLEDKVYKFYKKDSHQIFLEPEYNNEIYPNGLSTSLPYKNQIKIINSINGLEKTNIIRPGYSVEYDFFDPKNLKKTLESKIIKGLFLAGQVNGTTGYEEAAAQGVVAGINSFLYINEMKEWVPNKNKLYIGFMINELTLKGVTEPYRVFTSKMENRLLVREDNLNLLNMNLVKKLKLINKPIWNLLIIKKKIIKTKIKKLINNKICKIFNIENLLIIKYIKKQIYIYFKYKKYIKIQKNELKKIKKNKYLKLPDKINYFKIPGIPHEICESLNKKKILMLKDLKKISNITNNIILLIINFLKIIK